MPKPKKHPADLEQRRREIEQEAANSRAENDVRTAQCDPGEFARQVQENMETARQQGRNLPHATSRARSARPRPEVPGG